MTRRTGGVAVTPTSSPLVPIPFRPYVPPSVEPARKGASDYKRMPSVAAGVRRPYWGEGLK
jgi:hypothetical protein